MKPIKLMAKNFLGFENIDYTFVDGSTALVGENRTDDGQGSNGSGKSSFQQAIYYAYTGNNFRNSLDKKMIRKGTEEMWVELVTECPVRKETLTILRTLPIKGSSKLSLKLNGEDVNIATVKDGNDYILSWLAIPSEDLKSYFMICKEYYKSFFKSSNTDKLALISRFVNYSFIDKVQPVIDKEVKEFETEKRSVELAISKVEGKIEGFREQASEGNDFDFEADKENRINNLRGAVDKYQISIGGIQSQIKEQKNAIKTEGDLKEGVSLSIKMLREKVGQVPPIAEIEEAISLIREELKGVQAEQTETLDLVEEVRKRRNILKVQLQDVMVKIGGAITCPKCKNKFLVRTETSLEEEQAKKTKIGAEEKEYMDSQVELEAVAKEYEEAIAELIQMKNEQEEAAEEIHVQRRELENQIREKERQLIIINTHLDHYQTDISGKKDSISRYEEMIASTEGQIEAVKKEEPPVPKTFEKEIKELEGDKSKLEKSITKINAKIFKKNEWGARFKEFKMYLALEQIKNIQKRANEILKKENSDLRLLIEGFKMNAKGEMKDEITSYVVRDEAESFWFYSGGERALVEIAIIMAIQQMINETNPHGGLQFLSIDEVTEGLCAESLYNVIEALDFVKYPVLIATHIENKSSKCKTVKIVKENGVCRIDTITG